MSKRTITLSVSILILIVIGMFAFTYMKRSELRQQTDQQKQTQKQNQTEVPYPSVTRITGKHYFEDSVHTIVGEINMPTPCDLLQTDSQVSNSNPPQITLEFSVINNADFCAQQITPQRFKITANASEDATFRALFMEREVPLNLVPAAPGESPDDFQLYVKG